MLIVSLSIDGPARPERVRRRVTILLARSARRLSLAPVRHLFAAIGVILAAIYILYLFQKMFLGPEGSIVEEMKKHGTRHPRPELARDCHAAADFGADLLDRPLPHAGSST